MDRYTYKLCTICFTFNHKSYIEDTLNGFCMQQTNFPFVCTIVDDCSTDGEPQLLQRYLQEHFDLEDSTIVRHEETDDYVLTFAKHKTNTNCFFVMLYLKYNHYNIKKTKRPYISEWVNNVEYLACCEGDDYWTDSLKLQKQVDFLDFHPDYAVCSHGYNLFFQNTNVHEACKDYDELDYISDRGCVFFEFTKETYNRGWYIQPLTTVYRNGKYLSEIPANKYTYYRDIVLYYYILKQGKGALLKDVMGVYRRHDGGIFTGKPLIYNQKVALVTAVELYNNNGDDENLFYLMNVTMYGLICSLKTNIVNYRKILEILRYYRRNAPKKAQQKLLIQFLKKLLFLKPVF